ncbi:MAG: hypothetical protein SNJ64_06270, partial [Endomicrobiia bacterium]
FIFRSFVRQFLYKNLPKIKFFVKKNYRIINCIPNGIGVVITTGIDFLYYKKLFGKICKQIKFIEDNN